MYLSEHRVLRGPPLRPDTKVQDNTVRSIVQRLDQKTAPAQLSSPSRDFLM